MPARLAALTAASVVLLGGRVSALEYFGSVNLHADNFATEQSSGRSLFVKFYSPFCNNCLAAKPAWEQLGREHEKNDEVTIGTVDCMSQRAICERYGVHSVPVFLYFNDASGNHGASYAGDREFESLNHFVKTTLGATCSALKEGLCNEAQKIVMQRARELTSKQRKHEITKMEQDIERFRVEFSNREVELENERAAFKSVLDATLAKVNPGLRILKKYPSKSDPVKHQNKIDVKEAVIAKAEGIFKGESDKLDDLIADEKARRQTRLSGVEPHMHLTMSVQNMLEPKADGPAPERRSEEDCDEAKKAAEKRSEEAKKTPDCELSDGWGNIPSADGEIKSMADVIGADMGGTNSDGSSYGTGAAADVTYDEESDPETDWNEGDDEKEL